MGVQERIAEAIATAERCPRFTPESGDPCDGLDGCEECLRLVAVAVLAELNRPPEVYVTQGAPTIPRAQAVVVTRARSHLS
jgi:hypothetical protein